MKKLISLMLVMIIMLSFTATALAAGTGSFHGSRTFSSSTCKTRYITDNWITKYSSESYGSTYCQTLATVSGKNYSYAQALSDKADKIAMSDVTQIPSSGTSGYNIPLNSSANSYNTMHMRITNPYYHEGNHSNTTNMASSGQFWSTWS